MEEISKAVDEWFRRDWQILIFLVALGCLFSLGAISSLVREIRDRYMAMTDGEFKHLKSREALAHLDRMMDESRERSSAGPNAGTERES